MKKLILTIVFVFLVTLTALAFAEDDGPNAVVNAPSTVEVLADMAFNGDDNTKGQAVAYIIGIFELGYVTGIYCPKDDTTRNLIASLGLFALRNSPPQSAAAWEVGKVFLQAIPCNRNKKTRTR